MSHNQKIRNPYRSFFWPVILLGAGVIWLLSNLKLIPTENLWILLRLWPVLLIMVGLDVLFARRLPLIGALLGLLVIAGVVYILLNGSALGLEREIEPRTESFTVEVGDTTSVDLDLNLSVQETTVNVLQNSTNLLEAEIGHIGEIEFSVLGTDDKHIDLAQVGVESWFSWILPEVEGEELVWDIGLSPEVPFDLNVDASTGSAELDLEGMQLERFRYDASTGSSTIILPAAADGYDTHIECSTGSMEIVFPAESNLTVRLDGSTGRILLDVPEGAPVKVQVIDGGTGSLQLPADMVKVSGREGKDEGVYQTSGFESAAYQLVIIIEDISTGSIVLR
jgi:hypothetical protein